MLILTSKPQDQIVLDNGVTITVCRVDGHQTRIGIDAPQSVNITRIKAPKRLTPCTHP